MDIFKKLIKVQVELKAPKSQFNKFGNYNYRNCEDILEAVKPLLEKNGLTLFISDSVSQVGERFYIVAHVFLIDIETGNKIEVSAMAREEEVKKGMDSMQVTGATSSYARKYALNGLFLIDDQKDSDFNNKGDSPTKAPNSTPNQLPKKPVDATEKDIRINLGNILLLHDKEHCKENLKELTGFTGKDGKHVEGVDDLNKINGQRLIVTYQKAQKQYKSAFEQLQKAGKIK
ncbi:MAG: ERF family protein [Cetobacterium sp.]